MLHELRDNHLKVVLVPQRDPANIGACIRMAVEFNCDWYRELCSAFESKTCNKYNKFKTKVKRKHIENILVRMLSGKNVNSMYADWINNYAEVLVRELDEDIPF